MDSRDRLPLIHEQPSSQKQSHQEREKNQQNQTKKEFESTEPTFRIENREKKSREIDRRSSCTSECLSSLVSSTRKSRAGVDVAGTLARGSLYTSTDERPTQAGPTTSPWLSGTNVCDHSHQASKNEVIVGLGRRH